MYNDSIDTLLLRHYGPHGPAPDALEERLIKSVRQEARILQQQERTGIRMLKHRMSRRRAMMLVAIGSSGLGLLTAGLEVLDTAIFGPDVNQSALS